MAKIAVEFEQALARHGATAGRPLARVLAAGEGWTVEDLVCRSGPQDRPFEERHSLVSIAIVLAGTELALAFDETSAGFPAIDCTRLHVAGIMRKILEP